MAGKAYAMVQSLNLGNCPIMTAAGNFAMVNEGGVIVKKTVGGATQVTLPLHPNQGGDVAFRWIVDGKGDANTNNITVVPAAGDTINGASSFVINENYSAVLFIADASPGSPTAASDWKALVYATGSGTFNNLTATGTLSVTGNATLSGASLTVAANTFIETGTGNVAATGTVIGNAAALPFLNNNITGGNNSAGVQLPTGVLGLQVAVINSDGVHTIKVYPDVNGTVNAGSANAAATLAVGKGATYLCVTAAPGTWITLGN